MKHVLFATAVIIGSTFITNAQQQKAKPEDTEFYTPVPKVVTSGKTMGDAPSDAIILFNGDNLNEWVSAKDSTSPAKWKVGGDV